MEIKISGNRIVVIKEKISRPVKMEFLKIMLCGIKGVKDLDESIIDELPLSNVVEANYKLACLLMEKIIIGGVDHIPNQELINDCMESDEDYQLIVGAVTELLKKKELDKKKSLSSTGEQ